MILLNHVCTDVTDKVMSSRATTSVIAISLPVAPNIVDACSTDQLRMSCNADNANATYQRADTEVGQSCECVKLNSVNSNFDRTWSAYHLGPES